MGYCRPILSSRQSQWHSRWWSDPNGTAMHGLMMNLIFSHIVTTTMMRRSIDHQVVELYPVQSTWRSLVRDDPIVHTLYSLLHGCATAIETPRRHTHSQLAKQSSRSTRNILRLTQRGIALQTALKQPVFGCRSQFDNKVIRGDNVFNWRWKNSIIVNSLMGFHDA